jgi:hypothetical protein
MMMGEWGEGDWGGIPCRWKERNPLGPEKSIIFQVLEQTMTNLKGRLVAGLGCLLWRVPPTPDVPENSSQGPSLLAVPSTQV